MFGGRVTPSGVRSVSRRPGAVRKVGLKLRMPRRARQPLIRLMMRVRSPIRLSRSRFGRLASSSSSVGIATMLQWSGSPRGQLKVVAGKAATIDDGVKQAAKAIDSGKAAKILDRLVTISNG